MILDKLKVPEFEVEHRQQHGMSKTSEYKSWADMKRRCNQPTHPKYKWYGARGISIDPKWNKSFMAFFKDMGPRPSPKHTLDRIESNGNYNKANCRWLTKELQLVNRSRPPKAKNKYRGVYTNGLRYRAIFVFKREKKYLGTFDSALEAAKAWDNKAYEVHGELACLNFPREDQMSKGDEVREWQCEVCKCSGVGERVPQHDCIWMLQLDVMSYKQDAESLRKQNEIYREALSKIADYTVWDKATMVSAAKEALKVGKDE